MSHEPSDVNRVTPEPMKTRVRICFTCLGNICRSPTAEGIFRKLVDDAGLAHAITIDSAGTGDWHVGAPPDERASAAARSRGVELAGRAAHFDAGYFDRFDLLIAMDRVNRADMRSLARSEVDRAKVKLLRDFDPASPPDSDVPDPYHGGMDGFREVFDVCTAGCVGLLEHVRGLLRASR